jgi:hypothetical protein
MPASVTSAVVTPPGVISRGVVPWGATHPLAVILGLVPRICDGARNGAGTRPSPRPLPFAADSRDKPENDAAPLGGARDFMCRMALSLRAQTEFTLR